MEITAYRIEGATPLPIVPAAERREWHKAIPGIGACLPLTIANGAGWWLLNPKTFSVSRLNIYNYDVVIHGDVDHVKSHFGFGVMTVMIPYVFRTPPGWELLIRGPSNVFYERLHAFEGIVETDWHNATATMNWKVEKGAHITIEEGAPLVQVIPVQTRTWEEDFSVLIEDMPDNVEQEFLEFSAGRNERLRLNKEENKVRYEGNYPRDGRTRRRHLRLRPVINK